MNQRPHPYQVSRAKRCAERRFPRSPATVRGKGMRSNSSAHTRWWAALGASQRADRPPRRTGSILGQCRSGGSSGRVELGSRPIHHLTGRGHGRHGILDRRKYPLTYQDPAAESSTSAVTVKVAKRSPSAPDTASASGPGLAPPPGAARLSGSPGRPAEGAIAAGGCGPPRAGLLVYCQPMGSFTEPGLKYSTCPCRWGRPRPSRDSHTSGMLNHVQIDS